MSNEREGWEGSAWGSRADEATAGDAIGDAVRRLHVEGQITVETTRGKRFAIVVKRWADTIVRGYACRNDGARRVSTPYRMLNAGQLYNRIADLKVLA